MTSSAMSEGIFSPRAAARRPSGRLRCFSRERIKWSDSGARRGRWPSVAQEYRTVIARPGYRVHIR